MRAVIHLGCPSPDTSSSLPESDADPINWIPIWPCSGWGLPCRNCYQLRGALLPHPFTLTGRHHAQARRSSGGLLSVALSVGSRLPGVTWHPGPEEPGLSSRRENPRPATAWPALRTVYALGFQPFSLSASAPGRRDRISALREALRQSAPPGQERVRHRAGASELPHPASHACPDAPGPR